MKKSIFIIFSLFLILNLSGCLNTENIDVKVDMTPRMISINSNMEQFEIIDEVKSAVVGIQANLSYGTSIGRGVAIAENGYILTNAHVISGAKTIKVYFANQKSSTAEVIYARESLDLAIIKTNKSIPYLPSPPSSPRAKPNFSPSATRTAGALCATTKVFFLFAAKSFQAYSISGLSNTSFSAQ